MSGAAATIWPFTACGPKGFALIIFSAKGREKFCVRLPDAGGIKAEVGEAEEGISDNVSTSAFLVTCFTASFSLAVSACGAPPEFPEKIRMDELASAASTRNPVTNFLRSNLFIRT